MKLDRCMRLFALIVLLLSIGSTLITALIVSSDTLNIVQDVSTQHEHNDSRPQIPPIESDKNIEQIIISESKTETINVNSNANANANANANTNDNVINSDNEAERPNLELVQQEEHTLESQVIIESQLAAASGQQTDAEVDQSIEIENVNDDANVSPSSSATSSITTGGEQTNELFVDNSSVDHIESVLIVNNASNETESQQLNATEIPTVNIITESEAQTVPLELTDVNISADENKNDSSKAAAPIDLNLTVEENRIPVFSEWAQKRMEESEKEGEQDLVNTSIMKKNLPSANKPQVLKLKTAKNYASPDCGAKIIAANSESSGTGYVLTSTKDEYMLSPCKSRVWFVVELCEAIQAERIDLANFELFSSSPKNFSIGVSNRFPTRDWTNVGKFIAKDERYIQNFDLYPHLFGKYVRVDVHSHYNSEHFCPISLFRVYGISEFEAFETENRQHPIDDLDVDDDDEVESESNKSKSNIFQSASEAVMSIVDTVKKAVSNVKPNGNKTSNSNADHSLNGHNVNCITLNYPINCENCTEKMAKEVNAISECKQQLLTRLLSIEIVRNSLYKSQICANLIGFDPNINCSEPMGNVDNTTSKRLTDLQIEYITHLFSLKYITAMCNLLAANDPKYVWNPTEIPLNPEPMINVTIDQNANEILPETGHKTHKKTPPTDSVPKLSKETLETEEDEAEGLKPSASIEETTIHNDNVVSSEQNSNSENYENTDSKGIPSSSGESIDISSAENFEQNIFNVVEPHENVIEKPQVDAPTAEPELPHKNVEQATPPNVIILPESTVNPTTISNPTEINEVADDQTANGWTNTQQFGQKLHSESVFLRLSNRVKALERNMSLSGQYLEELSRGYKKQVEELQSSFAKTLLNIEEQSRKNIERKQELLQQNQMLRNELDILSERIFCWRNILIGCACFTCVQIVIFHIILIIWGRKYGLDRSPSIDVNAMIENVDLMPRTRKTGNVPVKHRRKSAEEKRERTISESSVQALQRRPSTEALNIMGTYAELLIDDSNSLNNDSPKIETHDVDIGGYVRIEDLRDMYEKPGNEYEFYGPASELKSNRSVSPDDDYCGSETTLDSNNENASPKKTKSSIKSPKNRNRPISSPSFFKSPFSSGSPAQSTGWEWHRSKKSSKSSQINDNKKSKSESPPSTNRNGLNNNNSTKMSTAKRKSSDGDQQQSIHDDSAHSLISLTLDNERKTTGSFKRLLKKIF